MEMVNDVFVLILTYHIFLFTDFVPDLEHQFNLGYSYGIFLALLVTVNLSKMFAEIGSDSIRKCKYKRKRT